MPCDSLSGLFVEAIEAVFIEAIDADELEFAGFDGVPESLDHPVVFVFENAVLARREDEQAGASVAKDEQLHFAPQDGAVPLVVVAGSGSPSSRKAPLTACTQRA